MDHSHHIPDKLKTREELAPVLARARAAARAAYVELVLRASRAGTRRWLARHDLDTDEATP